MRIWGRLLKLLSFAALLSAMGWVPALGQSYSLSGKDNRHYNACCSKCDGIRQKCCKREDLYRSLRRGGILHDS